MRVAVHTVFAASRKEPLGEVVARVHEAFAASGLGEPQVQFALADHAVNDFMRAALQALGREGKAVINRVLVDGCVIAAGVTLRSADCAWFWKIAYDERFARYSPGVLLTLALTENLLDDAALSRADSCATADHPMIDHIWRERLPVRDLLIALRPQAQFSLAQRLESLRVTAIAAAKRFRDKFRR